MTYCGIKDRPEIKAHIKELILWLKDEVYSASGDGDALWYSTWFDVNEIYEFIRDEIDPELKAENKYFRWELELRGDTLYWWDHEEALIITNDEETYKNAPSWQQCLIKW